MKRFLFIVFTAASALLLTSCIQNSDDQYEVEDFQTDNESYYREYADEEYLPDEDAAGKVWDVTFSFLGTINDGKVVNEASQETQPEPPAETPDDDGETSDDDSEVSDDDSGSGSGSNSGNQGGNAASKKIAYGSGLLTYLDPAKNSFTVSYSSWALKKSLTLSSGHEVPILQVFFADDPYNNADSEGYVTYYVLQLEGSSMTKSETYFLNNDKLYKTKVKVGASVSDIKEICYIEEPNPTQGRVNIYTSNIRIGEELKVDGYANMVKMEIVECKTMN